MRLEHNEDELTIELYEQQEYQAKYLGPIEVTQALFNADLTKCELTYNFIYELSANEEAFAQWQLPGPGTYKLDDKLWFLLVDGKWYIDDYTPNLVVTPVE